MTDTPPDPLPKVIWLDVALATPVHGGLGQLLTYTHSERLDPGILVRVPLGHRVVLGVVWDQRTEAPEGLEETATKAVIEVLDGIPPLNAAWRDLLGFAARYYQRGLGEMAMSVLPPLLKDLTAEQWKRRLKRRGRLAEQLHAADDAGCETPSKTLPVLTEEQTSALDVISAAQQPVLLFGATGSGKTEVYLRCAQAAMEQDPEAQVLVMVPEINLTPQLEARFAERFGRGNVASMHSGMTPAQRLSSWLACHTGEARIVLGTRMAVFTSLPHLRLLVVDEEHDPSYKSQEGARYSARDLAVYRAKLESERVPGGCRVALGSATPSMESWHAAQVGRYRLVEMPQRMGGGAMPRVRLLDMHLQPKHTVLAPALIEAMAQRAARGEQSMVLLNRRGYAPVLACYDCGWRSDCPHCTAHAVFHKLDRTLRCHHCGWTVAVPRACPDCGNLDVQPLGKGTEQLEERLMELLVEAKRPDGTGLQIARIDADSTRLKGSLEQKLAAVHSGDVDVLVGTQMIAKGHDFRRITLVASINPDGGLFASDYRAPERLFSLLMQAAGRAGRDALFVSDQNTAVELVIQTWYPQHPLFSALARYDYRAFATQQLEERAAAMMPPFSHQALVRAEARTQEAAQALLTLAAEWGDDLPGRSHLTLYPAVPMAVQRVANVERAQMLIESTSRPALQAFLHHWQAALHAARSDERCKGVIRWAIDVDPLAI